MKIKGLVAPKLVCGVGINDADYAVRRMGWICPFYRVWNSMLRRCYSAKYKERNPTYKGCSVSEEWLLFSRFRAWMEKQDWEGMQLDKDILFEGNKVYNPETCVFVTRMVNTFTINCGAAKGEWMVGVSWHKGTNKFRSNCSNPFTKKGEHLGLFTCEQEAHNAWLKRKLELAKELAAIQTDPRVAEALIKRYTNYKKSGSGGINSNKGVV